MKTKRWTTAAASVDTSARIKGLTNVCTQMQETKP